LEGSIEDEIACIDQQRAAFQRNNFMHSADDDDILLANSLDHTGTDLLVAPPEQETLPANRCDDNPGMWVLIQQVQ
jgi:hypothetical protein